MGNETGCRATGPSDAEILSAILSQRGINNPEDAARALLTRFTSVLEILYAERSLLGIRGAPAPVIDAIWQFRQLHQAILNRDACDTDILLGETALLRHLRATIAFKPIEHFHVIYIDSGNKIIEGRTHWTGSIDQVSLYPREVIFTALALGAKGMVLAHNHPSGRLDPSEADVEITRMIVQGARIFELSIIDHWIITRREHFSFRREGLL